MLSCLCMLPAADCLLESLVFFCSDDEKMTYGIILKCYRLSGLGGNSDIVRVTPPPERKIFQIVRVRGILDRLSDCLGYP